MKLFLSIALLLFFTEVEGQVHCQYPKNNDIRIENAVSFYKKYLDEFSNRGTPDYRDYWSEIDCKNRKTPDPIAFSISSEVPLYSFITEKTIFFVEVNATVVHLKTLFSLVDSLDNVTVFAITNHYIQSSDKGDALHFISPLEINKSNIQTTRNHNIRYHYPKSIVFDKSKSDAMLLQIRNFEKEWGFEPIDFDYFFAETQKNLAAMRGLDYVIGMQQNVPSGISFPDDKLIYCSGYGEGYFHEVLHLYLNPLYVKSPINHGLIYYLAGSIGYTFDELINRMNAYLVKYPETNLSNFEKLETRDNLLNIYNVITGLVAKIVYEKEGVSGLQRILKYKTMDEVFKSEFELEKKEWDSFLRSILKKYKTN